MHQKKLFCGQHTSYNALGMQSCEIDIGGADLLEILNDNHNRTHDSNGNVLTSFNHIRRTEKFNYGWHSTYSMENYKLSLPFSITRQFMGMKKDNYYREFGANIIIEMLIWNISGENFGVKVARILYDVNYENPHFQRTKQFCTKYFPD